VRQLSAREGEEAIALAREAMVTRERDLAAFSWGDARDVSWVDDGDGLSFVLVGSLPERRLPLPVVHGWLMLRSGIPVGYVQTDVLLRGGEISFNTFPTFRAGEAGYLFARVLAVSRHVLGAEAFSIEPYQLGDGNDEGIDTGAFWFYDKFGFRPTDATARRVLAKERERMRRNPKHRSSASTLRRLARAHVYFTPPATARCLLPQMPGLGWLLARASPDDDLSSRAADRLEARTLKGRGRDAIRAWHRLAPLVVALPGVERWSAAEKRAAVDVICAKGARREVEFAQRLDAHEKFARSLGELVRRVRY
jgi:hypothetical protein